MRRLLALALLVPLAACSGQAHSATRPKPAVKPLDSAAAIAKLVGCDTPLHNSESLAQVEKVCKVGHVEVLMDRYPDRKTAETYIQMGSGFGASYALVNNHWTISSNKRALVAKIAKRNGWDLR